MTFAFPKLARLALALCLTGLFFGAPASASPLSFFCTQFGLFCPAAPGFVPTYEQNVTVSDVSGQHLPFVLNLHYFATADTANTVCLKLGCTGVISLPCVTGGGPALCSAPERTLVFRDGFKANAGLEAEYWTNNPEDRFPGKAQRAAEDQMAADRAALGLPPVAAPFRKKK